MDWLYRVVRETVSEMFVVNVFSPKISSILMDNFVKKTEWKDSMSVFLSCIFAADGPFYSILRGRIGVFVQIFQNFEDDFCGSCFNQQFWFSALSLS